MPDATPPAPRSYRKTDLRRGLIESATPPPRAVAADEQSALFGETEEPSLDRPKPKKESGDQATDPRSALKKSLQSAAE